VALSGDISITLDVDWTDHPIVNVQVTTSADTFEVMADVDPDKSPPHAV
jgi:hypothetical protein